MQQFGDFHAFFRRQRPVGELDQIVIQKSLQLVQRGFRLVEPLQLLGVEALDELHRQLQIVPCEIPHLHHRVMGLLQSQRRRGEKAVVQHGELALVGIPGNQMFDQPDQLLMEGQQQYRTA